MHYESLVEWTTFLSYYMKVKSSLSCMSHFLIFSLQMRIIPQSFLVCFKKNEPISFFGKTLLFNFPYGMF